MVLDKRSDRLKAFRRKARIVSINCPGISTIMCLFKKSGGNSDGKHHPHA